ncbi:putative secondary metabolism biosynthetic enzyme [Penicillium ochrochloron]
MTTLNIKLEDIPSLEGKKVILTGGSSGIGLAAAKIFAQRGAEVLILDINPPLESLTSAIEYRKCDISKWAELKSAFAHAGNIDIAVANAGVSEDRDYFADTFDEESELLEPTYPVMELIGLVRSLRSTVIRDDITINAIAPAATVTSLLPADLAAPIIAAGLPVSTAEFVGLAVVYSASGTQPGQVELYGRDLEELASTQGRWNGRTILTLGDRYTELEGPIARLRREWFGEENTRDTRKQQMATDFRAF